MQRRMAILTIAAALAGAAPASGAVTVGSNLSGTPTIPLACADNPCTQSNFDYPTAAAAAGGSSAPIAGVITRWRIKAGAEVTVTSLRVLRDIAGTTATGAGTSAEVTPDPNMITSFNTRLPVQPGDRIGINCCEAPGGVGPGAYFDGSGANGNAQRISWYPVALADGERRAGDPPQANREVLINADIEPDADRDGFGDETQDQCPTNAATQGACPPPPSASCRGTVVTISGTPGGDVIRGTAGRDVIHGLEGADTINGLGGNDLICGAAGDDTIRGKAGRDTLVGGPDSDLLRGGKGRDRLFGGSPGATASKGDATDRCPNPGRDRRRGCPRD